MTKRSANLGLIWAANGEVADPDLDTTYPIFQSGKYLKGWIVEKEPHQWQNFLYQITDLKSQMFAAEQFVEWDSDISYAPHAVVRHGSALFVNDSTEASLGSSPDDNSAWRNLLADNAADVATAVNDLQKRLADHIAADNPHNDNIHDIGGYESGEIDLFLGDPTDERTIVYHKNQSGGAVHGETPAQVGTLPDSGGTFIGDVKFVGGITIGNALLGQDGPDQTFGNSKGSIHLTSGGVATSGADKSEIVTEANFNTKQMLVNGLFALPPPIGQMDFSAGNFSQMSIGGYSFDFDPAVQAFDTVKGWIVADGVTIGGLNKQMNCSHVFEYYVGDVKKIVIWDSSSLYSANLKSLATYFDGNITHFLRLTSYPRLTTYQKATIFKKV